MTPRCVCVGGTAKWVGDGRGWESDFTYGGGGGGVWEETGDPWLAHRGKKRGGEM